MLGQGLSVAGYIPNLGGRQIGSEVLRRGQASCFEVGATLVCKAGRSALNAPLLLQVLLCLGHLARNSLMRRDSAVER